jgi:thymidylate kinase
VFTRFPELARLRDLGYTHMHIPDATVFLDVAPETCVARIGARGKTRQVHETVEALARLRDAYLLVCRALTTQWNAAVLILDGERNAAEIADEAAAFVFGARRERG